MVTQRVTDRASEGQEGDEPLNEDLVASRLLLLIFTVYRDYIVVGTLSDSAKEKG